MHKPNYFYRYCTDHDLKKDNHYQEDLIIILFSVKINSYTKSEKKNNRQKLKFQHIHCD